MNYLTVEVEINHGHVQAKGPEKLPEKASGLLTLFPAETLHRAASSPLAALESLQQHLRLDAAGAAAWLTEMRAARR
jgi:hypothetical protein